MPIVEKQNEKLDARLAAVWSCPLSARAVRAIACAAVSAVRFPRASMALLLRKVMAAIIKPTEFGTALQSRLSDQ